MPSNAMPACLCHACFPDTARRVAHAMLLDVRQRVPMLTGVYPRVCRCTRARRTWSTSGIGWQVSMPCMHTTCATHAYHLCHACHRCHAYSPWHGAQGDLAGNVNSPQLCMPPTHSCSTIRPEPPLSRCVTELNRLATVGAASAEKSLSASQDNQYDFIQDAPQLEVSMPQGMQTTCRGG